MYKIIEKIKNEKIKEVLIVGHIAPDGDAIGSSVAMARFLNKLGKKAYIFLKDIPETFKFLLENLDILNELEVQDKLSEIDQIIFLDAAISYKFPNLEMLLSNNIDKICIDHHLRKGEFIDDMYVEETSPSTTQILYKIFSRISETLIDKEIMQAIITGLITDTGGFKYYSTNAESFEIAKIAYLKGVDIAEIFEKIDGEISISQLEIENLAVSKTKYYSNNKIASTIIYKEELEACNVKFGEVERIAAILRNIKGVELVIFGREIENGYKLDIRRTSKCNINLNKIANKYGCSGHEAAIGIIIKSPTEPITVWIERVLKDIQIELGLI